ncbi:MAG: hypothetical protein A2445_03635 [Candidatus Jacksonbacteria bacterium RIFOXYC2_FULL_44_29]|nr:MAG: hypothetical protein UV19_C0011G0011 [Parcubacteria group bacterium GW2011_GWA2_42_28]KKT53819.1 MAG: hypothetical protein UW45_C0025G0011 [Parcubacteria group bacterium GW2011_GWC2_44_22]OGY76744.1 MAG: hypothetical protein A2240_00820 [Candidatus Jacksonbacteria bacterium RIFOXYA2_FULL_43_12]OGY77320.1 MAG: hypothetical protein A2295_03730 [Candidatus Jacksonbacteria bacterium RIFOXYB2_FULL_44_15]OGY79074.1 MAG: hypothetical protein A2550_04625 [Candidatus Jacksonbacteria bacterium RI
MNSNTAIRYWEIDAGRGVAILMMILYHFLYDLTFLKLINITVISGFWLYFARTTLILFLLLVGVGMALSYVKHPNYKFFVKRGLFIFLLGLLITLVTRLALGGDYVRFGILHLIGISIILGYLFIRASSLMILLATAVTFLGGYLLQHQTFTFPYLSWAGLKPINFSSVDYTPIIPWFGVILVGILIGRALYPLGIRKFKIVDAPPNLIFDFLRWLGRNSLLIYLLHQPVLVGTLSILQSLWKK